VSEASTADAAIRWGICGTGKIADKFVESLANVADAEVVAVGSRTQGRSADFALAHDIPRYHDSYVDLAADDAVDVVYVANTQDGHRDATILMLEAGRHVLCEKPIGMNSAQLEEMIVAAQRNQRFLMEALWSRFLPGYATLTELLDAETVGTIRLIEANFAFRVPDDVKRGHRLFDLDRGGGALLDIGIYPLQLAQLVLGAPVRVAAVGSLSPEGIDEQVAFVTEHEGGASAVMFTSLIAAGSCGARIVGDDGVITIDPTFHAPSRLRVARDGHDEEIYDVEAPSLHHQVPEVHRCIRAGRLESDVMPWSESRALHATLDDIRRQIDLVYPGEKTDS